MRAGEGKPSAALHRFGRAPALRPRPNPHTHTGDSPHAVPLTSGASSRLSDRLGLFDRLLLAGRKLVGRARLHAPASLSSSSPNHCRRLLRGGVSRGVAPSTRGSPVRARPRLHTLRLPHLQACQHDLVFAMDVARVDHASRRHRPLALRAHPGESGRTTCFSKPLRTRSGI